MICSILKWKKWHGHSEPIAFYAFGVDSGILSDICAGGIVSYCFCRSIWDSFSHSILFSLIRWQSW